MANERTQSDGSKSSRRRSEGPRGVKIWLRSLFGALSLTCLWLATSGAECSPQGQAEIAAVCWTSSDCSYGGTCVANGGGSIQGCAGGNGECTPTNLDQVDGGMLGSGLPQCGCDPGATAKNGLPGCYSGQTCSSHGSCGEPCGGHCVPKGCNTTTDCVGGQVCKDQKCGPCASNADCQGGQACVNELCGPCGSAKDCSAGQGCVNGACTGCVTSADC